MPLSLKQVQAFNEAEKRLNIWVGAVRSGKTFSSIIKLIDLIKNGPRGSIMIIGVNRDTIQRNVLLELYRFLGFSPPGTKTTETKLYGRNVYFVGAHDEGAVRRIQGSTLAAAYVDEATCIPAPFWRMLLSRLSVPGAQLLATCNPEGPSHWLKKEYIDRCGELDLVYWNFNLDDNPSLTEKYKEDLKKEYSGMWFKRYILGEWAVAHGLIYDCWDFDNIYEHPYPTPNYYIMGVDYGTSNATAAVMCAVSPRQWPQIRVEEEYYYDSAKKGRSKTDSELADDLKEFIGYRQLSAIYVDPAAASLKVELRRKELTVYDAKNDVLQGIKTVSKFVANKNLVVQKGCKTLIECIQSYAWDPKAADRGEDKPLKERDHICFTGDTLIRTLRGPKRIDDISVGDKVITRNGIRSVIANGYRKSSVFEYEIANKHIKCTEDHPFFTVNRSWVKCCDLIRSDILISVKEPKRCLTTVQQNVSNSKEKYIDDIQMLQHFLKRDISNAEQNISIGLFGNPTMEKSQKDIISITSTKTHLIMIYPIWNVFLSSNIQKDIQKIVLMSFQTNAGRALLHGIDQILGKNGISKKLLSKDLESGSPFHTYANFVKSLIKQKRDLRSNFVRIIVNLDGGEDLELTMSLENALDVLKSTQSTNTRKHDSALKLVQRKKIWSQMVFNLSVEEDKEYFANDILVSNCDALRYACYSAFPSAEFSHPDENLSIDQIRRKVYGEEHPFLNISGGGGYA